MTLGKDVYYVERVAGRQYKGKAWQYLIEWDKYPKEQNSWESEENLLGNKKLVMDFEKQLAKENPGRRDIVNSRKKVLLKDAWDTEARHSDSGSGSPDSTDDDHKSEKSKDEPVSSYLRKRSSPPHSNIAAQKVSAPKKVAKVENLVAILLDWKNIQKVTKNNTVYKRFFNSVNASRQVAVRQKKTHLLVRKSKNIHQFSGIHPPVTVVNSVDDEVFPPSFTYIDSLVFSRDVEKPDPDFLVKCQCTAECNHYPSDNPCHEIIAYDKHGQLKIQQGTPIYECNSACNCDSGCSNRVVQRGRQFPLQIFKTTDKGWGVRAMVDIKKGAFVEEYIGEVITESEGDFRGKNVYDRLNCSYLFDMDFMSDSDENIPVKYVIDSFLLGNASHFFNHSCRPNLAVFVVYHDSGDPQFHRMAFFANRAIHKGEELTFDYMGSTETSKTMTTTGKFPCNCNARACRRWIHK